MITELKPKDKRIDVTKYDLIGLRGKILEYNNRFTVLMRDMDIDIDSKKYHIDKGTLLRVTVSDEYASNAYMTTFSYMDRVYLKVYTSVTIEGIIDGDIIKKEILYTREYAQACKAADLLGIDNDVYKMHSEELCAYSAEKMLEYLEENFAVLQELDNECANLSTYCRKLDVTDIEVLGFLAFIFSTAIGASLIYGVVVSRALVSLVLFVISAICFVAKTAKKKKYRRAVISEWRRLDEITTSLVAVIENREVPKGISEEVFRITQLVPLIERDKENEIC